MSTFRVTHADQLLTALADEGLLPDHCGDVTVVANLNEPAVIHLSPSPLLRFVFTVVATDRHVRALQRTLDAGEFRARWDEGAERRRAREPLRRWASFTTDELAVLHESLAANTLATGSASTRALSEEVAGERARQLEHLAAGAADADAAAPTGS